MFSLLCVLKAIYRQESRALHSCLIVLFVMACAVSTLQIQVFFGRPLRLRGGIYDPWELSRMCDLKPEGNVTADIVEDWTLEKERALWNESEQELERHWQRQRWVA